MDRMRSLRQIVTLADAGNFRKAAERLGVTHSALSQAIAKLEDSYGVPLFVRNKQETVPTAFGRRMVEAARQALVEIEPVLGAMYGGEGEAGERVADGSTPRRRPERM